MNAGLPCMCIIIVICDALKTSVTIVPKLQLHVAIRPPFTLCLKYLRTLLFSLSTAPWFSEHQTSVQYNLGMCIGGYSLIALYYFPRDPFFTQVNIFTILVLHSFVHLFLSTVFISIIYL